MKQIYTFSILLTFFITSVVCNAQCFEDGHSTFANQGWLSCNTSMGPIPERGDRHWVMYDFGEVYAIDSLHFWNHNTWGETGSGAQEIMIDYSIDQQSWSSAGPFILDKAPGSWKYTGTSGPSLANAHMQYVLITILSTWDESSACAGIAEIRFDIGEPVDTEDNADISDWTLGPNPVSEQITLSLPEYGDIHNIEVHDAMGRNVMIVGKPSAQQISVQLNTLPNGLFYVTIHKAASVSTKSFIKG